MFNPVKLGLAGGIVWGIIMFICTILSMFTGYATEFLTVMYDLYPGYTISFGGSILGLIYGFIDAFIILYFFARVYNKLNAK